jgi:hypothetical protein
MAQLSQDVRVSALTKGLLRAGRTGSLRSLNLIPGMDAAVYGVALFSAFCLGFSKAGFPGLAMVNVMIMAELFGAKESVGIILPLLIVSDFTVYPLFRQYASWKQVWPLLIPAFVGIAAGYGLLGRIDNQTARRVIGGIVLLMLGLQLLRAYRTEFLSHLPDTKAFLWGSGVTIGVSTMMANAAGPAFSIYSLVHRMAKADFLGIGARTFLVLNLVKVPFMTDLNILNLESLKLDLALLPGTFLGILAGYRLIARIPQRVFEVLLYFFSLVAGVRLLFF